MKYILDSCALLSYILGEKEALNMKKLFSNPKNTFYLNYINYGEIIFTLGKKGLKSEDLEKVKESLKMYLDLKFLKTDDFETVELAADYKIGGGLSYFDALILVSSHKHKLKIITKDKEFKKFNSDFDIQFL